MREKVKGAQAQTLRFANEVSSVKASLAESDRALALQLGEYTRLLAFERDFPPIVQAREDLFQAKIVGGRKKF